MTPIRSFDVPAPVACTRPECAWSCARRSYCSQIAGGIVGGGVKADGPTRSIIESPRLPICCLDIWVCHFCEAAACEFMSPPKPRTCTLGLRNKPYRPKLEYQNWLRQVLNLTPRANCRL